MKRTGLLLAILLVCANICAFECDNGKPVYYTQTFSPKIRSLECENFARKPRYPIIELGSSDVITLKFDDFSPEINTYGYRIIHCNAIWQQDELSESQYIDGFTGSFLDDYKTSQNTFFGYTHYDFQFPNDDARPVISGNYVIEIYESETPDTIVATARFMVVESVVGIYTSVTSKTDIDVDKTHQQVNLEIDYPEFNINLPASELKVVVQQNRRLDNQVELDTPSFYEQRKLIYKMNPKLVFDAGNEFRTFDISQRYVLDRNMQSIEYFKPYYHATLYPSEIKAKKQYEYWKTVGGRFIINMQDVTDPDIEGDYYFVHFTLPVEYPFLEGKLYILSQATGYLFNKESEMTYNYEKNQYEAVLLLKQGGYNFMYAYLPSHRTKASLAEIEGNFWQTNNEYATFVYYHPFGSLYDMLIGYNVNYYNYK